MVWRCGRRRQMGGSNQCALPVSDSRLRSPNVPGTPKLWTAVRKSRMSAKPSGGRKRKGKTPMGFSGIHSTNKWSGQARRCVDWCCNCTRHSTCLTLGLSARACYCRNARFQCMDCVCWRQCKNRGAFLSQTPGEGLLGHFRAVEHVPPANSLYRRAPVPEHGTKGGRM